MDSQVEELTVKQLIIEEKKEELNFSSELEIDERFEDAADKL